MSIYTEQLCRMRYAYDRSRTRVVSCKSNLQLAYDCRVRYEECRELLKHVLKPYRSDRKFNIVEIVYDFSMTRAARAIKIACDNRKQKLGWRMVLEKIRVSQTFSRFSWLSISFFQLLSVSRSLDFLTKLSRSLDFLTSRSVSEY